MWKLAWRNLVTRPMRSLLALCGLTVAIAGMVGLYSVAEGIDALVNGTFGRIPGLVVMQPGAPIPLFSRLPAAWGDEIRQLPGVHVVHPEVWSRAHLIEGKPTISPPRFLFGISIPDNLALRTHVHRDSIIAGRFLTVADIGTWNCVISRNIAREFQKQVGDTLQVDSREMTIVGIYHGGSVLLDVAIILDQGRVREASRMPADTVCSYYVEQDEGVDPDTLVSKVQDLFRGRSIENWSPSSASSVSTLAPEWGALSGLAPWVEKLQQVLNLMRGPVGPLAAYPQVKSPGIAATDSPLPGVPATAGANLNGSTGTTSSAVGTAAGNGSPTAPVTEASSKTSSVASGQKPVSPPLPVEVRTANDFGQELKKLSADLDLILLILTSIGMLIAILGIVNTMLMSVTERFIEFGVLKANGWSDRDVLTLITLESAILGIGGGCSGAAVGWLAAQLINARFPDRLNLYASPNLLAFSIAFSVIVGVFGGLYPAIWASRLSPMEAIRRG